jgi:phage-related tail protein
VFEACAREYAKTKDKLSKVEKEIEELREHMVAQGEADDELVENLKERTGYFMGGRSSNERKWRDAQVAFSNMLKVRTDRIYSSRLFLYF